MNQGHDALPPVVGATVGDVIALLEAWHGISGLRMVQANYIAYGAAAGYGAALPLHVDYHYSENPREFVYSALLYLSSATAEDGGATAFTDAPPSGSRGDWEVAKGLLVQPARGRLAVFSSGAENVHAGRDLLRPAAEERKILAMWFNCGGVDGGAEAAPGGSTPLEL